MRYNKLASLGHKSILSQEDRIRHKWRDLHLLTFQSHYLLQWATFPQLISAEKTWMLGKRGWIERTYENLDFWAQNSPSIAAFHGGHGLKTQLATMSPESQQQVSGFSDPYEIHKDPALVSISTSLIRQSARILILYIQTAWKVECYI